MCELLRSKNVLVSPISAAMSCRIMDKHLLPLASTYFDTKFIKVDAEVSYFGHFHRLYHLAFMDGRQYISCNYI